jgi:signal transduction histidine kinase
VRGRSVRVQGLPLARRLDALNTAALAISGDLDLDRVLTRILKTAASLARARYGALGVPDGRGGFGRFLTVGVSERRAELIGQLPRVHGVLGALVTRGKPIRVRDIRRHPLFSWYPEHHPEMRDFLGVPIRHRGEILGNVFLSGARSGSFTAQDQRLLEMLAAHAGGAISTARLYAKAQELAVLEERNRVAKELHDAISQTLFSMVFQAKAGALKAGNDPGAAEAFRKLQDQASAALSEMRSLVLALRPKSLERDGLPTTLLDHVDALKSAHGISIELRIEGAVNLPLDHELALLRIAQEALQNAIKHGGGAPVSVLLREERAGTLLVVRDAGGGFEESALPRTARTIGLTSMRERAAAIGADLEINARPDRGCVVTVFVPPLRSRQR